MAYTDNFDAYLNGETLDDQANWTTGNISLQVRVKAGNGAVWPTDNVDHMDAHIAGTYADNQYSQAVVKSNSGGFWGVCSRCASGTMDYYEYNCSSSGRYLNKKVSGSNTTLASTGTGASNTDVIRLECEGTTISPFLNGSPDGGISPQTDSAHSSGYAGLGGYGAGDGTNGNLDTWEGGDLGAAPPPSESIIPMVMHHRKMMGVS